MVMKKILTGVLALVFLFALVGCYSEDQVNNAVNSALTEQSQINEEERAAVTSENRQAYQLLEGQKNSIKATNDALIAEVNTLKQDVQSLTEEAEAVKVIVSTSTVESVDKYTEDDLELGGVYSFIISDRDLEKLYDTEVEFDGEDYDVEETLEVDGIEIAINNNDYAENVYMVAPKESIMYAVNFAGELKLDDISNEDTLEFKFLGETVEIVEWDGDEITFFKGSEHTVREGESIALSTGKIIEISMISKDYLLAKVTCDGSSEQKKIVEGDTREVCDVEIYAKEVLDDDDGTDIATIVIGEEVESNIKDGDEYDPDDNWNWIVEDHMIGLILDENFDEIDEEYNALAPGSNLCVPNDYVCIIFDGLEEEDFEDYSFELDTEDGTDYVEVIGKFIDGIEDYNRIYVNDNGIYDDEYELIDSSSIYLGDSDIELVVSNNAIVIDDIKMTYELDKVGIFDGNTLVEDLTSVDDSYRTEYGTIIDTPEDNIDDNEVILSVPMEQLTASVSFI